MGSAAILISTPAIRCGVSAFRARVPRPGRTGPLARPAPPAAGTGRVRRPGVRREYYHQPGAPAASPRGPVPFRRGPGHHREAAAGAPL